MPINSVTNIGKTLLLALVLAGCQPKTTVAPIGLGCLPQAPNQKLCRDLPINNAPAYPPKTTPSLTVVALDPAFQKIVGLAPKLIPLVNGFGFTEGPAYVQMQGKNHGYLMFSDGSHNSIYALKWNGLGEGNEITTTSWEKPILLRNPSGNTDGMTIDANGRLIMAEEGTRSISRLTNYTEQFKKPEKQVEKLASRYNGIPLNSPNDITVRQDGTIWFTDPTYGHYLYPPLPPYLPTSVYRYDPSKQKIERVSSKFDMPNGLAFSPDGSILYVVDSGASQGPRSYFAWRPHAVFALPLTVDGKVKGNPRKIADIDPGFPDGIRVDSTGNLYVTNEKGVSILSKEGKLLGKLILPFKTGNLTFGGKENNILFICSGDSVWAIKLNATGAVPLRVAYQ